MNKQPKHPPWTRNKTHISLHLLLQPNWPIYLKTYLSLFSKIWVVIAFWGIPQSDQPPWMRVLMFITFVTSHCSETSAPVTLAALNKTHQTNRFGKKQRDFFPNIDWLVLNPHLVAHLRENGHSLLLCSSLSTAQFEAWIQLFHWELDTGQRLWPLKESTHTNAENVTSKNVGNRGNIYICIHLLSWKLTVQPENHPLKKGKSSSKPPFLCSILGFQECR